MQSVKVKKSDLIDVLTKNRDTHRAEYQEALGLYRAAVVKHLEKLLEEVKSEKPFALHVRLPEPSDHTEDYDRELRMLDMSVDDVIELNVQDFDTFIMDNWDWKDSVSATNMFYKSAIA